MYIFALSTCKETILEVRAASTRSLVHVVDEKHVMCHDYY